MSTADAAYNPLAYHNGTVWPHDNSLIALGLARYGRWSEAQRIVQRLLEAGAYLDHQLPEVFAGLPRAETPFPIAYPTAARPHALESVAPAELPSWAGSMRLSGVTCFDRRWTVRVDDGHVKIEPE